MNQVDSLFSVVMDTLREKMGDRVNEYAFPPPIFTSMQGEFVELDMDADTLTARFPVLESYLNPYGTMQGGMVAAAIDNTLGPLSVLVAPPNVTRRLEMKYSHPVTVDMGHIIVHARLLERKGRWLYFKADAQSQDGLWLVRAKATHWILED